jgi:replicative DNA helicase
MARPSQEIVARPPPHSIELEQVLLGCCVLEGGQESLALCIQRRIGVDSFYYPAHRAIFQEILEIYGKGKPLDEVVLRDSLAVKGALAVAGGAAYIAQLCSRIDTQAHLSYFIDRVRDYELIRRIIATAENLVVRAYDSLENVSQFLSEAEEKIFSISKDNLIDAAQPIDVPMTHAVQNCQFLLQRRGELTGVGSGFPDLDRLTAGFHQGEMVVIAARPSMGKTSLALNIAENAILPSNGRKSVPTLFFSLEMGADQLAMRLLCARADVNLTKLRSGYIPGGFQGELLRVAQEFREAPLWIDESSQMTILEVRARARRLHSKHKLGLVIIDYLQLLAGTDNRAPREQQIAEISRGVKAMARELRVPVVVLSQLNRDPERENRQPRLSDLRESGAIEQDADVVMMLSRPKDNDEDEGEHTDSMPLELLVAKQRNGPTGVVLLMFDRGLTKFKSYCRGQQDDEVVA